MGTICARINTCLFYHSQALKQSVHKTTPLSHFTAFIFNVAFVQLWLMLLMKSRRDNVTQRPNHGPVLWAEPVQRCVHFCFSLSLGHAGCFLLVAVSTSHWHGRGFWEVWLICVPPSCCGIRTWCSLCVLCWPGHAPIGKCISLWLSLLCQKLKNIHREHLTLKREHLTFHSDFIIRNWKAKPLYLVTRRIVSSTDILQYPQ